jgi:hypothetical protein
VKGRKRARARQDPRRDERRRTSSPRPRPPLRRSRTGHDLVDLPAAAAVAELFEAGGDLLRRDADWGRTVRFDDDSPRA